MVTRTSDPPSFRAQDRPPNPAPTITTWGRPSTGEGVRSPWTSLRLSAAIAIPCPASDRPPHNRPGARRHRNDALGSGGLDELIVLADAAVVVDHQDVEADGGDRAAGRGQHL